jgi:DNA modification methylase
VVLNDHRADWREAWALFPGDVAYVWHAHTFSGVVKDSLEAVGFEPRSPIVWVKDRFALSRAHFHFRHEALWYAVRKGKAANWKGGRKQDTVWEIDGPGGIDTLAIAKVLSEVGAEETVWRIPMTVDDGSTGHGTQKPVECMRRPMELNSAEGDLVYEPFSGSGSCIIAGEQSGRRVLAMELSPAYVDVAVRRWQAFTGLPAVLQGDGRAFALVEAERNPAPPEEDDDASAWS